MCQDFYKKKLGIDFLQEAEKVKTLEDYNDLIARLNGLSGLKEYEDKSTLLHAIPHIKVPSFYLVAKDDPISGYDEKDLEVVYKNENVLLGVTDRGSHGVYYESVVTNPR